jgi:hypothetical protein
MEFGHASTPSGIEPPASIGIAMEKIKVGPDLDLDITVLLLGIKVTLLKLLIMTAIGHVPV